MELSAPNYRDWKTAAKSYASTGVYFTTAATMRGPGEPRRLAGASVSADLFPTLGVTPLIGHSFSDDDDRPGAVGTVMLSYRLWQTEFAGDPDIVGHSVILDDEPYSVRGVMPRDFHFPDSDVLYWTTNRFGERNYVATERTDNCLEVVGRLRPGVAVQQAAAELDGIAAQLRAAYPSENKDTGGAIVPLGAEVSDRPRLLLIALSGAAACVLLIACANLANLLLARALARRRELAVRTALGAGRERLIRQLMTEGLLLAVAGGAVGIAIAMAAVPLLTRLVPDTLPIAAAPSVDVRVLLVAATLTAFTGLVFGLVPVFRIGGRPNLEGLRDTARSGGGQKERLRSMLVVAEIAASVVLLVCAGLLIRALMTIERIDPGFNAQGVLTMQTDLPMPDYGSVAHREAFYEQVLREVRVLPGVQAAGWITALPMSSFRGGIWPVSVKGDIDAANGIQTANNVAALRFITPGYLDAMAIALTRGRDVRDADRRDRPFVAVVSESFAKRYWPNADPIGRHFTFAFADREVIGVARDVRFRGLERPSEPQVYLSSPQVADGAITFYAPKALAVRASVPPASLASAVRGVIRRTDPRLPITNMRTMTDLIDLETAPRAVQVRVLSAFAAIAFLLAAVGIHGVLSFAVSQRTSEIAVRRALGAQSSDIMFMVLSRGAVLALAGVAPGVLLAYAAGRSMEGLLSGVHPADAVTLVNAVGATVIMTLVGSAVSVRRALRVDPITALRAE
jgi:predicted permease